MEYYGVYVSFMLGVTKHQLVGVYDSYDKAIERRDEIFDAMHIGTLVDIPTIEITKITVNEPIVPYQFQLRVWSK